MKIKKNFKRGVNIFMLVAAGLIPAFMLKSCDNGTTSNRNEPDPNQPLIDAIAWARGEVDPPRKWTSATGLDSNILFTDSLSDDVVRPSYTFMGIVENALTNAWETTYKNNTTAWNATKWKEIIGKAFNATNSYFDPTELPLTISKINGTKNTLGKYMRELQGRNFG